MVSQKEREKLQDTAQFPKQSAAIIREIENESAYQGNHHFGGTIDVYFKTCDVIPNDFDKTSQAN